MPEDGSAWERRRWLAPLAVGGPFVAAGVAGVAASAGWIDATPALVLVALVATAITVATLLLARRHVHALETARAEAARLAGEHVEQLRRSEARYRSLVEASSQIIWSARPSGEISYGSVSRPGEPDRAAFPTTGWGWLGSVHPDDQAKVRAAFRRMANSERDADELEFRLRQPDGRHRIVHARAVPVLDAAGRLVEWVGAAADVTEQREAEQAREELLAIAERARGEAERAARLVQQVQRIADAALVSHGLDDVLVTLLHGLCEALAVDSAVFLLIDESDPTTLVVRASVGFDEATGRPKHVRVGEGFSGRIAAERQAAVAEGEVAGGGPSRRRSVAGVPLVVDDRLLGVLDVGSHAPRRFDDEDLTLLRLAGDRAALLILRALATEAEQRARAEAEAANRAKDEFLALLSHELRSPLNAMVTWLNILSRGTDDPRMAERAIAVLNRGVRSLTQLVNDLLDVSRIVSGKLALTFAHVDLVKIVSASVEAFQPVADARPVRLAWSPPAAPIHVRGDAERLQQLVGNLLNNAVKFTPAHGRVDVSLATAGSHVELQVRDTGDGIAPELLPFVFDRFRQADYSPARKHGGLGLGLAIVRHVVERHGGTVTAESLGEGRGSTFTVRFPIALVDGGRGLPAEDASRSGPLAVPSPRLHVLLVDDESDSREAVALGLELRGLRVTQSASVADALERYRAEHPDVVVSDIAMPGEDGYTLIRRLREAEGGAVFAAIAITGFASSEDRTRAIAQGFDEHLPKPVDIEVLAARIERLARAAPPAARRARDVAVTGDPRPSRSGP